MFDENSFITVASALKLQVIDPSFLKKLSGWQTFTKLIHPVNAMKYRFDFLFFVNVNLRAYNILLG